MNSMLHDRRARGRVEVFERAPAHTNRRKTAVTGDQRRRESDTYLLSKFDFYGRPPETADTDCNNAFDLQGRGRRVGSTPSQ